MEEKKRELLLAATSIYMRYGIKSMTMDEMARQLGISKKTLYLYVTDKNNLVEQCVSLQQDIEQEAIQEIVEHTENAIEQMLRISKSISETLSRVHPSIFFDLARYHPSAQKMMECHKEEYVVGCIEQNLVNGINQGLYRKNLNAKVIAGIYVRMIDIIMSGDLSNQANLKADEIYSEVIRYHIRGCASEKGLKYLTELIKKDKSFNLGL
ncbi:MAG: TetR/AcrR family transcriptional regulator [Crocinitomicaceae bacterium]